jgi:hypothetical protein
MYIEWSTEKELKRHMSQYHPDPEAFSWKFPHVKKPPAKLLSKHCRPKGLKVLLMMPLTLATQFSKV